MATNTLRAPKGISQEAMADLRADLIALAISQSNFIEWGFVVKTRRAEIEAKLPGASRLVNDPEFIRTLVAEHNASVRP